MPEPLLKPKKEALTRLAITRSKAKMFEFDVPEEHHIKIEKSLESLFPLAISILGDIAAQINRGDANLSEGITIRFAAFFFDAYVNARLAPDIKDHVTLFAAAGYYLCDLPGSANVLAQQINLAESPFSANGLEDAVTSAIQGKYSFAERKFETPYRGRCHDLFREFERFSRTGDQTSLNELLVQLRNTTYEYGSPDQIFWGDILCAIIRRRILRSVWATLPTYSQQSVERWMPAFQKTHFHRELWPSQMLLGERGVYAGASAVVQMPTSAGKTRAIELIIRSRFISSDNCTAVIVAPFRALCHEISANMEQAFAEERVLVDELSDVLENDFEDGTLGGGHVILVVTPEKLLYVIRQNPDLANNIGLLVYDEGHQFETGIRGVTFELLLASLRDSIQPGTQTVLISAVIAGAERVAHWLFKETGTVVSGENIAATYRSTAFVTWTTALGQLEYVGANPNEIEYFVPRIIEEKTLALLGRERTMRTFPHKNDANSVALYLALKVAPKGTVALFCGRKSTAINFSEDIADLYLRSLDIPAPAIVANAAELERLVYQHEVNLGTDAPVTKAARHGVVSHHAQIPFGTRLAVENALREDLVRVVICTSTLAQGVNMPIKYLIFSGIYQGGGILERRDFQNLVGRAGRAGMHTEGSIIFATHDVYDNKHKRDNRWRWQQMWNLLTQPAANECKSSISQLFEPIINRRKEPVLALDLQGLASAHTGQNNYLADCRTFLAWQAEEQGVDFSLFEVQLQAKLAILSAIESFLMAHWREEAQNSAALAESTLAYMLADEDQKQALKQVFSILALNIGEKVPDPARRQAYSRTLFGVADSAGIETWVRDNLPALLECRSDEAALKAAWTLFADNIRDTTFSRINPDNRMWLAENWIAGYSFGALYEALAKVNTRIGDGVRPRALNLHQVVEMCESSLGYHGALVAGAIRESLDLLGYENYDIRRFFERLQKRLKYGLATDLECLIYEVGFKDRVLAQKLATIESLSRITTKRRLKAALKGNLEAAAIISRFPSLFSVRFSDL